MNRTNNKEHGSSRSRLLATVSGMALIVSACVSTSARAEPTLWFELGWNFENFRDSAHDIAPPLGPLVPRSGITDPLAENLKLDRSYTDEGRISFQPENSDWIFSGSIRYGRSRGKSTIHQELAPLPTTSFVSFHSAFHYSPYYFIHQTRVKAVHGGQPLLNEETNNAQSHFIVDFEAGKDVGLGLFGSGSTSTLSAGVRFAHFTASRKASQFHESPGDVHFESSHSTTMYLRYTYPTGYHYEPWVHQKKREFWSDISASGGTSQKFNGIGPSVRWDASAAIWGNTLNGLSLDWGVNAALLYGKQRKTIHHQSTHAYHCLGPGCLAHPPVYTSDGQARTSKSITVPNVGGFAGFSLKYPNVKVSLGYRADLFVNAVDVGFATRKSSNLLFHGPFASLSIGVGD